MLGRASGRTRGISIRREKDKADEILYDVKHPTGEHKNKNFSSISFLGCNHDLIKKPIHGILLCNDQPRVGDGRNWHTVR